MANISISEATESDLPDMVELCCNAMEPDILTRFLYGESHTEAVRKQTESLMASLGKRFTHPTNRCYIHKVVDTDTRELIGWSIVRWEDGSWCSPARIVSLDSEIDKRDFPAYYGQESRRNWSKLVANKPHVVLGALYIRTDQQRRGIGRHLVEYLYTKYELDKEIVIAQTRAISEGFYMKLGWETVDSSDFDLSEWGGNGRGFGVHRSPQMIRYPRI